MVTITLPFNRETSDDTKRSTDDVYRELPKSLQEATKKHPHLLDYLCLIPFSQVGIPQYHSELTRKMGDNREPNIIYPAGDGIFIHIMVDFKDSRHYYIPVEPTLTMDLDSLVAEIETMCIELSDRLAEFDSEGDKKKQLLAYIDQMVTLEDQPTPDPGGRRFSFSRKNAAQPAKVSVTQRQLEGIKYLFVRDKLGLGVLDPLLTDPYIEDIGCSGIGHIFIEHKIFKGLKSSITFPTIEEIDLFVLRLAEQIKKPVTFRSPIADATLPDGSRINIVYGRDVSRRGSNFSIRKFSGTPLSIFDLVDFGTLNYEMLAYLSLIVGGGMNVFVAGESASGKTAMLNALTTFMSPVAKIVSIEDTPELQVPHQNWIREVVQTTKTDDSTGAIGTFDLLKAALRQRPNQIMVGEIRGPEGAIAFQAMQTGHSVMSTFHAASVEKLIQRMTSAPISVPLTYIDNLNVAIMMSTVKLTNGKTGRRVTSIAEIVGYDSALGSFNIIETFRWDGEIDRFDYTGYMTSYILEHKIAPIMGIPGNKKQRIYAVLEKRAKVLARLHQEGVTDFFEVLNILGKAQQEGLF